MVDIPTMADLAFTDPAMIYLQKEDTKPTTEWERRLENKLALTMKRYGKHKELMRYSRYNIGGKPQERWKAWDSTNKMSK